MWRNGFLIASYIYVYSLSAFSSWRHVSLSNRLNTVILPFTLIRATTVKKNALFHSCNINVNLRWLIMSSPICLLHKLIVVPPMTPLKTLPQHPSVCAPSHLLQVYLLLHSEEHFPTQRITWWCRERISRPAQKQTFRRKRSRMDPPVDTGLRVRRKPLV